METEYCLPFIGWVLYVFIPLGTIAASIVLYMAKSK